MGQRTTRGGWTVGLSLGFDAVPVLVEVAPPTPDTHIDT